MNILENYLDDIQLNEDVQFLSEDFSAIISKLKTLDIKKKIESLKDAADSKNVNKIKSIFKAIKLPEISVENVKNKLMKTKPEFKKSYVLSQKVIQNSIPNLPEKNVDSLAIAVAAKSLTGNQSSEEMRKDLVKVVTQTRKYVGAGSPAEMGMGTLIVIIFSIFALLSGAFAGASITILLVVGALLTIGKVIVD